MNHALILAFMAAIMSSSPSAYSQTDKYTKQEQVEFAHFTSPLYRRYEECIANQYCSMEERLEIMAAMNAEMQRIINGINAICLRTNDPDCIGKQAYKRRVWKKLNAGMNEMMFGMSQQISEIKRDAGND